MAAVYARAEAAVYTDAKLFQAATVGAKSISSPLYSAIYTDAYGSFSPPATVAGVLFTRPIAGAITGQFGCFGNQNPCRGAYRETITLPYQITALSGQLSYYDQGIDGTGANSFNLPLSAFSESPFGYSGFYAETFAPTNTLTFSWGPGFRSYDESANFTLSTALFIVATPEPAALALLLAPIFGTIALQRRRQNGAKKVATKL